MPSQTRLEAAEAILKTTLPGGATFWRVEGSLVNLSAVRPVAFFTWNAQTFLERWARRGGVALLALVRPFLYALNRVFATRVLHTLLRGVSQDRLDLLGEEYFHYYLQPRLKRRSVEKLKECLAAGGSDPLVLVSQGLDHVMRPLAQFLGVQYLVANRLEFRDGIATGRLLHPVIRPRGGLARLRRGRPDARVSLDQISRDLGYPATPETVTRAICPARRLVPSRMRPIVRFDHTKGMQSMSVRAALAGKHILLIGVTGFIGKVWLVKLLTSLVEIGKIYLLIRRQRSNTALQRFEKIVEESPVFESLHERYGDELASFLGGRVEVVEGDVCRPGLGLDPETRARLVASLDLVVNSSGLTDFNPDLRDALATNTDAAVQVVEFVRECDHAALLHLSTCYVVGAQDGRVPEELRPNYTPARVPGFDAEQERRALRQLIQATEARAESAEMTEEFRRQALQKSRARELAGAALENQIRKNRIRWVRSQLTEAGPRRARELGWPNTYTLTKSLAESLLQTRGAGLPMAIVRPSIVESSTHEPFPGWNEGVNTSGPLSYLLGTYFRQLPSNERKRLDLIPVDLVCRGMTLIAAALLERRHQPLYQLATSASNPCNMRRSIELTCLAHRKHYRAQEGMEHWLRYRFDTIPVSKARYRRLSAPGQKAVVHAIQKISEPLLLKKPPLARAERSLDRVEKLIELYEPFILHNDHAFEAQNVALLSACLPPEEREAFGYDDTSIDWWAYWINVHIPALRKWAYPLIEGRPLEARSPRAFRMPAQAKGAAVGLPTGAPWPSS